MSPAGTAVSPPPAAEWLERECFKEHSPRFRPADRRVVDQQRHSNFPHFLDPAMREMSAPAVLIHSGANAKSAAEQQMSRAAAVRGAGSRKTKAAALFQDAEVQVPDIPDIIAEEGVGQAAGAPEQLHGGLGPPTLRLAAGFRMRTPAMPSPPFAEADGPGHAADVPSASRDSEGQGDAHSSAASSSGSKQHQDVASSPTGPGSSNSAGRSSLLSCSSSSGKAGSRTSTSGAATAQGDASGCQAPPVSPNNPGACCSSACHKCCALPAACSVVCFALAPSSCLTSSHTEQGEWVQPQMVQQQPVLMPEDILHVQEHDDFSGTFIGNSPASSSSVWTRTPPTESRQSNPAARGYMSQQQGGQIAQSMAVVPHTVGRRPLQNSEERVVTDRSADSEGWPEVSNDFASKRHRQFLQHQQARQKPSLEHQGDTPPEAGVVRRLEVDFGGISESPEKGLHPLRRGPRSAAGLQRLPEQESEDSFDIGVSCCTTLEVLRHGGARCGQPPQQGPPAPSICLPERDCCCTEKRSDAQSK
eukprot:TRINITY_DN111690_c0_g1_i1.p1 TRINITY_DN111690_c0_g1~~TRINITY_DN111690_c0_g1_i1.p1  ORF type:complete len:531 (+),score=100.36 TRINITY_DN111690_c0_g1_i1:162-1754(+)